MNFGSLDNTLARNLGYSGEDLVSDFFISLGESVQRSENAYDNRKDLIVSGECVEVKTQVPYRFFGKERKPAFTVPITSDNSIHTNQLNKCVNVDRLIFVKRPSSDDRIIRLYEAPRLGKRYFEIIQNRKDQRFVAGFYIDTLTEIGTISDANLVNKFMEQRY